MYMSWDILFLFVPGPSQNPLAGEIAQSLQPLDGACDIQAASTFNPLSVKFDLQYMPCAWSRGMDRST